MNERLQICGCDTVDLTSEQKERELKYKLLNKKINLFSCSKSTAEKELWEIRLGSCNDALKPDVDYVNIVYYPDGDKLTIIESADIEKDKLLQAMVEEYLTLAQNKRDKLHQEGIPESVKGVISVLDRVITIRFERHRKERIREEMRNIKEILRYNDIDYNTFGEIETLYDDRVEESKALALVDVFSYGVIIGKRAERSKKKRPQAEVAV